MRVKILLIILLLATANMIMAKPEKQNAHEGRNQVSQELFTGLETDAALAVIAFHDAINNGNSDRARNYLDDAIIIFEGGGVERSADEYASHHMLSDMAFLKNLNITSLEHQVKVNGIWLFRYLDQRCKVYLKIKKLI